MNKFFNNNWFKTIVITICSISIGFLSIYLMVEKVNYILKLLTFIGSFSFSFLFLFRKYDGIIEYIKNNNYFGVILFVLGGLIFYLFKKYLFFMGFENRILSWNYFYLITLPGFILIFSFFLCEFKKWIISFVDDLSSSEKKIHIFISVIMIIVLYFLYRSKTIFYNGYDIVYSFDSKFVLNSILPKLYYYDIRHPLMSILTFPVYSFVDFIFNQDLKVVIFQFINVQMILVIGLELKKITNNKYVYYMYLVSFPSLIFLLFLEKYVICIFLITTYLYNIIIKKKNSYLLFPFIVGTMPTNIYTIVFEFFRNNDIKNKLLNVLKIGIICFLTFILFGRVHCFFNGIDEINKMKKSFASKNITLVNKINSTSNMIEGSFIELPSSYNNGKYLWNNILDRFSYLSVLVLIIMVFGLISALRKKNNYYLSFASAVIFSFVLFIILNWSTHESPLFSFCFSWAIIPLFVCGIDYILDCFKIKNKSYIYCLLIVSMFIINIYRLIDICKYY